MNTEAASDQAAHPDTEAYQIAAREGWRAAGAGGCLRLTVTSGSMLPLLRSGEVVVVQPIEPRALQPGVVIVVQRGEAWITHRLVAIDERGWHTRGDNARYADAAVGAEDIVGLVIAIERGDQTIDLQQARWRALERRINRLQRWHIRLSAALQKLSGNRSNRITHAGAALISWPFQLAVRWLARS